MNGQNALFLKIGAQSLLIDVHQASFQDESSDGIHLLTSWQAPLSRRILHHQECLRPTDRAIGVGKISSEAESVSWLQIYLLFFWSEAHISFETEEEFLRARQMSEGAVDGLCRQRHRIEGQAWPAVTNKQWPDIQPSI